MCGGAVFLPDVEVPCFGGTRLRALLVDPRLALLLGMEAQPDAEFEQHILKGEIIDSILKYTLHTTMQSRLLCSRVGKPSHGIQQHPCNIH
jgi:hypothetical protein